MEEVRSDVEKKSYVKPVVEAVELWDRGRAFYGVLACSCRCGTSQRRTP
jgi:hypothetical protein